MVCGEVEVGVCVLDQGQVELNQVMRRGANVAGTSQYILLVRSNAQTLAKRQGNLVEPLLPRHGRE
jgi:hypothetical protein